MGRENCQCHVETQAVVSSWCRHQKIQPWETKLYQPKLCHLVSLTFHSKTETTEDRFCFALAVTTQWASILKVTNNWASLIFRPPNQHLDSFLGLFLAWTTWAFAPWPWYRSQSTEGCFVLYDFETKGMHSGCLLWHSGSKGLFQLPTV